MSNVVKEILWMISGTAEGLGFPIFSLGAEGTWPDELASQVKL